MKSHAPSLSHKLWFLVIGLLVACTTAGALIQWRSEVVSRQAQERLRAADQVITLTAHWRALTQLNTERVLAANLSTEPAMGSFFGDRLKAGMGASRELQDRINALASSESGKVVVEKATALRGQVLGMVKQVQELKGKGDVGALRAFVDKSFLPMVATYDAAQADVVKLQEQEREQIDAEAGASLVRIRLFGLLGLAATVAAGIVASAVLLRSLIKPLRQAVTLAEAIAEGDLRHGADTPRRDEIGRLLNAMSAMSAQLRRVVTQVREGVGSVSVASAEIATGNHDLSARTEQTASNLQETAASLEQVTGTIGQSSDTTREASRLALLTQDAAGRGSQAVGELVGRMDKITQSSRKIADILSVIDGIAFQTNILALNAAVEAARAGEQGRGFAVVAGEVRTLAQRSGVAAKEIRTLITESVETVDAGARHVGAAQAVLDEVVDSARKVSGLIGELAHSASEQRGGIEQVNQAIGQIDQMTQQNAALVEQAAAAATSMSEQTVRLTRTVAHFQTGDAAL